MKPFLPIIFLIIFSSSYSQITQLSPSKFYKVGKIENCSYDNNNERKCNWIAQLNYGILNGQRIYSYKYRAKFGALGETPRIITKEIRFLATGDEIEFLYSQIKEWIKDWNDSKPERLYFSLGEHTLEVSFTGGGVERKKLYFTFEKTEDISKNWWINGILFDVSKLGMLFGKEYDPYLQF